MSRLSAAVLALVLAASTAAAQSVKVGTRAPEIDLPTLTGGRLKLSALRGHPVVVTFWQTWCPSCRTEFPELVAAQANYGPAGLYVVAVNDPMQEHSFGDGEKHVRRFADEFAVSFQVALDKRGRARDKYGILSLPTTVFIDSAGVVQGVNMGPTSREQLERGIAAIVPHP
jgi:thiol-disulfide isomerase/thioredoxin